ncbi:aminotransferase class V-fold PLP-dependent enzyme [Thalassotalea euphylliae]|nr:cysteine desulfurase [Thalassotalea euphylliae]
MPNNRWRSDFAMFTHGQKNAKLCAGYQQQLPQAEQPLHYLDSAATCLIPQTVVESTLHFQQFQHANSHRGFYSLSANLTAGVEQVRDKVANFIGAGSRDNIVFTSNTTQAIHLAAQGYLRHVMKAGDNVVISVAEHHANFLPWQQLAAALGAQLRVVPLCENARVDLTELAKQLDNNTKLVALNHMSNVLGTVNDIAQIAALTKTFGAKLLVDGAQYVAHHTLNVDALGCDFYAFSGHKLYAGYGAGVLYVADDALKAMVPVVLGGGIVQKVTENSATWLDGARKLEAGSLNSQALLALSAAINYLEQARCDGSEAYLEALSNELYRQLNQIDAVQLLTPNATPIVAFNVCGIHSHDLATVLSECHVAVRAGHHCAQPLLRNLGVNSCVRVSLGLYNDQRDIDALIKAIKKAITLFGIDN